MMTGPDHAPSLMLTIEVMLGPPGGPHELRFSRPHGNTPEIAAMGTCRQLAQLASAAVTNSLVAPPPETVPDSRVTAALTPQAAPDATPGNGLPATHGTPT